MDNVGNCNTTAKELHVLIPHFEGMRTRCFPHIVNLIAKVYPNLFIRSVNTIEYRYFFLFSGMNTNEKRLSRFLKLLNKHVEQLLLLLLLQHLLMMSL